MSRTAASGVPWPASAVGIDELAQAGRQALCDDDPQLHALLQREYERQARSLTLVASCSPVPPGVLACMADISVNVTAEGYPGNRYHAGCEFIDQIEQLAIDRARQLFGATFANVQPHSASIANELVTAALLRPGERLLGMDLRQGGHLTHGSPASISGSYYDASYYGIDAAGFIDYDQVRAIALAIRPKLIICGATAYPRPVDFRAFRAIADEAGALLLADISHIAGLVAAGLHENPVDHAHITTTCTHKQLFGPRGGLILLGRDRDMLLPDGKTTLAAQIQRAVFPFFQGAPAMNIIAAKAHAFALCATSDFAELSRLIVADARALAAALAARGYHVISRGTDNHIVLLDLRDRGLTGVVAQDALEECRIIVNKNPVPRDPTPPSVSSGLRLGTNTVASRGLTPREMDRCAELTDLVLRAIRPSGQQSYELDAAVAENVRRDVSEFVGAWPVPGYRARLPDPHSQVQEIGRAT
jgi:glycine hydroxymethyltransferase